MSKSDKKRIEDPKTKELLDKLPIMTEENEHKFTITKSPTVIKDKFLNLVRIRTQRKQIGSDLDSAISHDDKNTIKDLIQGGANIYFSNVVKDNAVGDKKAGFLKLPKMIQDVLRLSEELKGILQFQKSESGAVSIKSLENFVAKVLKLNDGQILLKSIFSSAFSTHQAVVEKDINFLKFLKKYDSIDLSSNSPFYENKNAFELSNQKYKELSGKKINKLFKTDKSELRKEVHDFIGNEKIDQDSQKTSFMSSLKEQKKEVEIKKTKIKEEKEAETEERRFKKYSKVYAKILDDIKDKKELNLDFCNLTVEELGGNAENVMLNAQAFFDVAVKHNRKDIMNYIIKSPLIADLSQNYGENLVDNKLINNFKEDEELPTIIHLRSSKQISPEKKGRGTE